MSKGLQKMFQQSSEERGREKEREREGGKMVYSFKFKDSYTSFLHFLSQKIGFQNEIKCD